MIAIVASCTLGTAPCIDSVGSTSSAAPWWVVVLIVIGAIALIAGFIGLLQRANRKRPWD